MDNKNKLKSIAGACFVIIMIINFLWLFSNSFSYLDPMILAYLLLAMGLFAFKPKLSAIGVGALLVKTVLSLFSNIYYGYYFDVSGLLGAASLILLLLACLYRNKSRFFGIASAALQIIVLIYQQRSNAYFLFSYYGKQKPLLQLSDILADLLLAAGTVLLGIVFDTSVGEPAAAAADASLLQDTENDPEESE